MIFGLYVRRQYISKLQRNQNLYIYIKIKLKSEKWTSMGHKSIKCRFENKKKLKKQLKNLSSEIRIYLKWEQGKINKQTNKKEM